MNLEWHLANQHFPNGYAFVNGVRMQAENPEGFQIPPRVIKRHVRTGHFVELRLDSSRFSVHEDAPISCTCSTCKGEVTKPILSHDQPASLVPLPPQKVPSRGWGEDFWVRVERRDSQHFQGIVDNPLYESRKHELNTGDVVYFHEDHILAVHVTHRQELVSGMNEADIKELVHWLGSRK